MTAGVEAIPNVYGTADASAYPRAVLNILTDFNDERIRLQDAQRAVLNILDDADNEKARLETTQRAVLNILEDFDTERAVRERVEAEVRLINNELEQRVRDRTAELESANNELQVLVYSMAHDLRAPARHIRGYAELLQRRNTSISSETEQHYRDSIVESAVHLGRLIDDLLAFARLSRGETSEAEVNLDELLRGVVDELSSEMTGRSIVWTIEPLPEVQGDRSMLRIVLGNLIGNALKFTRRREEARIEIGGRVDDHGDVTVFIRDNGVGFDMQYADKLFGVFQRLHSVDEFEGTGIGLASVERIVRRHGGRVWAESEIDKGATFYVSLPRIAKGGLR